MNDLMRPDAFAIVPNPQNETSEQVASFVNKYVSRGHDAASDAPGAPPLWGEDAVPHVMTFASLVGTFSRAYQQSDEALQDSWENARMMRNDVGIMESLEARQRMTAQLEWSIEPEDDKHYGQVSLARELERIIKRIRRFTEYKRNLMEGIWFGKYAVQNRYGWQSVNGKQRLLPTSPSPDHSGWMPIHGDKIVYRYDDGSLKREQGEYAHQMGIRTNVWNGWGKQQIHKGLPAEPTGESIVQFLTEQERMVCTVHKHFIEDADYYDPHFAGSVHGVGIRSRIYWEYTLKQETLAFLMEYLERSAGGIEVWTYPSGDKDALAAVKDSANKRMANGKNQLFFPKPIGDDASAYNLEIVEPGFAGADILQNLINEYFGHRIKRYILGQTLSSEADSTGLGSGVADAHMDTLSQIVNYDAANLEDTLTFELVKVIQMINFPETAGWHMKFKLETQTEDSMEILQAYQLAFGMGAEIPAKDVMHTLGLGQASGDEQVLSQAMMNQTADPMGMQLGIEQDGDGDGIIGEGDATIGGGMEQMGEEAEFVQQYSRDAESKEAARAVLWSRKQWRKAANPRQKRELKKAIRPLRKVIKAAFVKEQLLRAGRLDKARNLVQ